ncbi:MAG TPA: rhomboid family intramembrane serine protease [Streptosporangiaceae bacterium]
MMTERILEGVLFAIAVRTGVRLLSQPGETAPALARRLGRQRPPIAAIIITTVLAAGCVLELAWPGALDALRQQPSGAWWQAFTAPFVQEGIAGALFNLISAAIVLALAEWQWGRLAGAAIWLTAAWAPVGDLAQLAGYHVSAANVTAYSAGSSGATYFTAATLCAALLGRAAGRTRLLGLVAPAIAAGMWILTNDGHGVLFTEGFVLGLLLRAGQRALHLPAPADGTAPPPAGLASPGAIAGRGRAVDSTISC